MLSASDVHLVPHLFTHDVRFEAEKKTERLLKGYPRTLSQVDLFYLYYHDKSQIYLKGFFFHSRFTVCMKETSGTATEDGPLWSDRRAIYVSCRKETIVEKLQRGQSRWEACNLKAESMKWEI